MLGDNIKKLREAHAMPQTKLADYCGVTQQAVGLWEKNKTAPDHETLIKIATLFNVTTDCLLDVQKPVAGVRIPIFGSVPAGIPLEAIQDIDGYEEITPALAASGEYFALRIKGDSMAPRICDGDVVIIKNEAAVESGDIAIVLVNGNEATCKEVQFSKAGLTLVGWNVAAFSPVFFTKEEVENLPVRIIGRVVEARIKNLGKR